MNLTDNKEIERLRKKRQQKIVEAINDKDSDVIVDDVLDNEMILNMGPQHPATHGVLRVLLRLDGEKIIKCVPELGYLHRGFEKLAENVSFHEFIPHTDRLDYLSPLSNNVAYTYSVERLLGIEVPERAEWIRTIISEMARISSHLMAMAATCMDVGALTMLLWGFTEREKLYDIFELICGARFTTSYSRIGGLANDIDDATIAKLKEWLKQFPEELKYFEKLVNRNRIFIERMAGIGYLPPEKAIELGCTGPVLRGSGIARDLRRDFPYFKYNELDFEVCTHNDCDVWGRYFVRIQEMKESVKILNQALDKMPKGEIRTHLPKKVIPKKAEIYTKMEELIDDFMLINFGVEPPVGECFTSVEAPKGELGFYIVSNGKGHPWKMKIRSPSASNLQALPYMAEGSMVADVVAIIGSIDPVMGEADK